MAEFAMKMLPEGERTGESVAEICRRRGISRDTYYRYKRRYLADGVKAGSVPTAHRLVGTRRSGSRARYLQAAAGRHPRWDARRVSELERTGNEPPARPDPPGLVRNDSRPVAAASPQGAQALRAGGVQRPLALPAGWDATRHAASRSPPCLLQLAAVRCRRASQDPLSGARAL